MRMQRTARSFQPVFHTREHSSGSRPADVGGVKQPEHVAVVQVSFAGRAGLWMLAASAAAVSRVHRSHCLCLEYAGSGSVSREAGSGTREQAPACSVRWWDSVLLDHLILSNPLYDGDRVCFVIQQQMLSGCKHT